MKDDGKGWKKENGLPDGGFDADVVRHDKAVFVQGRHIAIRVAGFNGIDHPYTVQPRRHGPREPIAEGGIVPLGLAGVNCGGIVPEKKKAAIEVIILMRRGRDSGR